MATEIKNKPMSLPLMERIGRRLIQLLGVEAPLITDTDNLAGVMSEFFGRANTYIKLVEGELEERLFTNPKVLSSLKEATLRGAKVEIMTGPELSERSRKALASIGVDIFVLERRPPNHFAVADGRHALIEEYHVPGQENRSLYVVPSHAFIPYSSGAEAALGLAIGFENMKALAKRVEPTVLSGNS